MTFDVIRLPAGIMVRAGGITGGKRRGVLL